MALPNVLNLGLLWLTLNLALIIECLAQNSIFFSPFYIPPKMSSRTPEGLRTPDLDHWSLYQMKMKTGSLNTSVDVISKYRQPSFATVLQRALLYTYITTCFG
jgi:hypothetical protein